jgi:hypothetical protein
MAPKKSIERTIELLQEAARRANWDAHIESGASSYQP